MGLSGNTVFEVRTAGNDNNGGGFVAGAGGVDYSQQDSAQYTFTNLVVDATTNTKVTSASHNFVAADVGNIMQITAGTGWTTGFYQIVSVASNAATLDRSPAATSTTGGTFAVGGAIATWSKAINLPAVPGNKIWVKAGTYTQTSTPTPVSTLSGTLAGGRIVLEGYTITRGDRSTRPLITTSTNSVSLFSTDGNAHQYLSFINIDFTCTAATKGVAFSDGSFTDFSKTEWELCSFDGFNVAVTMSGGGTGFVMRNCIVKNTAGVGVSFNYGLQAFGCVFKNIGSHGIDMAWTGAIKAVKCIFDTCGGSGIHYAAPFNYNCDVDSCTFYNCTVSGIDMPTASIGGFVGISNSLFYGNGAYGVSIAISGAYLDGTVTINRNNFYGANLSGPRNNWPVGVGDVSLTTNPFSNSATGDLSLNNISGGGLSVKGSGYPGVFPSGTITGYSDGGAVQHRDIGTMAQKVSNLRTLQPYGATNLSAGGTLTSTTWDLHVALGGLLSLRFVNGATAPSSAPTAFVYYSPDGSTWRKGPIFSGDTVNSSTNDYQIRLPREVMYVQVVFNGGSGQAVGVEALGQEFTALQ